MKQTLFLLPKDDSRNSAAKQTHKKRLHYVFAFSCVLELLSQTILRQKPLSLPTAG